MSSSVSLLSTNLISVLDLGKVVMQQSKKLEVVFMNGKKERIADSSVVKNIGPGVKLPWLKSLVALNPKF